MKMENFHHFALLEKWKEVHLTFLHPHLIAQFKNFLAKTQLAI
jgi:hypothetical protein